jgi:hypothetical protein
MLLENDMLQPVRLPVGTPTLGGPSRGERHAPHQRRYGPRSEPRYARITPYSDYVTLARHHATLGTSPVLRYDLSRPLTNPTTCLSSCLCTRRPPAPASSRAPGPDTRLLPWGDFESA